MMMFMLFLVVVMMMALTFWIVAFVLIMVVMMVIMLFFVVVMMMALAFGIVAFVLIMMMVMMMFMLFIVVVMVALAFGIVAFIFIMVVMMLFLRKYCGELRSVDDFEYLFAVKHIPRCRNDNRFGILFAYESDGFRDFFLFHIPSSAQNYSICACYLIVVKFAEVFHIHFALRRVRNGCGSAYHNIVGFDLFNGAEHIGKLSYT